MKSLMLIMSVIGLMGCQSSIIDRSLYQVVTVEVANLETTEGQKEFLERKVSGAGVFISPNGHILTAAHLFSGNVTYIYAQLYGQPDTFYGATLLHRDTHRDLALLKITYFSPNYARFAPPYSFRVGDKVTAIGHPLGLDWTVTQGIVSKFDRSGMLVQTDAAINKGNSGGPLYDEEGRLIGINIHLYTPSPFAPSVGLGRAASVRSINGFLSIFKGLEVK